MEFGEAVVVAQREAALLDERRWEEWVALYSRDCRYWVPTWKHDWTLATNPDTELSHIYYDNQDALRDRISRLTDPSSPASNPLPRTVHILVNFRELPGSSDMCRLLRATWTTHLFFPKARSTDLLFGHIDYDIVGEQNRASIASKKVVMYNDFIKSALDVYCF